LNWYNADKIDIGFSDFADAAFLRGCSGDLLGSATDFTRAAIDGVDASPLNRHQSVP